MLAAVAYIPFGFLVTLLAARRNTFLKFHARQGFVVTLLALATVVVASAIAILTPYLLGILLSFALDTMLAFIMISGAWHAFRGYTWEMPIFGAYAKSVKF